MFLTLNRGVPLSVQLTDQVLNIGTITFKRNPLIVLSKSLTVTKLLKLLFPTGRVAYLISRKLDLKFQPKEGYTHTKCYTLLNFIYGNISYVGWLHSSLMFISVGTLWGTRQSPKDPPPSVIRHHVNHSRRRPRSVQQYLHSQVHMAGRI